MEGKAEQERRSRGGWLWALLALLMIVAAVQACSWLATLRLVPETVSASGRSRLQADYGPWESVPLLDIDLPALATAAALGDEVVWDGGPAQVGGAAGSGNGSSSGSSDGGSGSSSGSGASGDAGSDSSGSGSSDGSGSSGQSGGSSGSGPGASSSNPTPTASGSATRTPTSSAAASSTPVPSATTITASNTPLPSNTPVPPPSNTPVPPPTNTPLPPPTNTPVPPPTDTPVPANGPPNAQNDSVSTTSGAPTSINVLGNDSDPDGNLNPDSVSVISGPSNGTILNIQPTTGEIRYRSNGGFTGVDSFTYQVCDFAGLCDTATVTITVN